MDDIISLASEPGGGVLRDKLCLLTNSSFDSGVSKVSLGSLSDRLDDSDIAVVEKDPITFGDEACSGIVG